MDDHALAAIRNFVIPSGIFVNQTVAEMEAIVTTEPWAVLSRTRCPKLSPVFKAYGKMLKAGAEAAAVLRETRHLGGALGTVPGASHNQLVLLPRPAATYSQIGGTSSITQLVPLGTVVPATTQPPPGQPAPDAARPQPWYMVLLLWFASTYDWPADQLLRGLLVFKTVSKYFLLFLIIGMARQPRLGIRIVARVVSFIGITFADAITDFFVEITAPETAYSVSSQLVPQSNVLESVTEASLSSLGLFTLASSVCSYVCMNMASLFVQP